MRAELRWGEILMERGMRKGEGSFDSILSRVSIPLFSFAPVYPVCVCVFELQAQAWRYL